MRLLIILALALILTGCPSQKKDVAVPRPVAYPRIETPAPDYGPLAGLPVFFLVNTHAVDVLDTAQSTDSSRWYTITYPQFPGMAIYCTFSTVTPVTMPRVVENRTERMALNTGGADSEILNLTSEGGFNCTLTVTRAGTATPVQFLAAHDNMVVSGAMYVNIPSGYAPDSIAPMVDAVRRDLLHSLKKLSYED